VQDIQQFLWSEQQVNEKLKELMLRAVHGSAVAGDRPEPADADGGLEPGGTEGGPREAVAPGCSREPSLILFRRDRRERMASKSRARLPRRIYRLCRTACLQSKQLQ